ncbi:hypothetical protein VTK73DRAFT_719 [Phialemonium thermophilum]|uniref:Uncharacterized protein n=1 Tax=Phialemonium thermophilum TaxID=223376 RepID=A0ABR3VUG8_9PEZI
MTTTEFRLEAKVPTDLQYHSCVLSFRYLRYLGSGDLPYSSTCGMRLRVHEPTETSHVSECITSWFLDVNTRTPASNLSVQPKSRGASSNGMRSTRRTIVPSGTRNFGFVVPHFATGSFPFSFSASSSLHRPTLARRTFSFLSASPSSSHPF